MAKKRNSAQPMLFGFEGMADSVSEPSSGESKEQSISVSSNLAGANDVAVKSDAGSAAPFVPIKARSTIPSEGDLVVITDRLCHKIRKYEGQTNLWGKVTWVLEKK